MSTEPNMIDLLDGESGMVLARVPMEACEDMTRPGPADEAAEYWIERCEWIATDDELRSELARWGAWDKTDLAECDTDELRTKAIWINAETSLEMFTTECPECERRHRREDCNANGMIRCDCGTAFESFDDDA